VIWASENVQQIDFRHLAAVLGTRVLVKV